MRKLVPVVKTFCGFAVSSRTAILVSSAAWILASVGPAAAPKAKESQRVPVSVAPAPPDVAVRTQGSELYGRLPLAFEANPGQAHPQVKFLSRGPGYTLFLASTEAVLSLNKPLGSRGSPKPRGLRPSATEDIPQYRPAVMRMKVVGANPSPTMIGIDELPGKSNYFLGKDPAAWHTAVPSYGAVRYEEIYPGVDLLFHGSSQRELEYDFVVGAGADPGEIRLRFEGSRPLKLDDAGNLLLRTAGGEVIEKAPVAYFGGSNDDAIYGVAVDTSGSAYVTGQTCSADFPAQPQLTANSCDAFVSKFSPDGASLVYSTYLGGASAHAVAVDATGSAYVSGITCSASFPTVNPVQASLAPAPGGGMACDAFVAKLAPAGNALVYSTYLGGPCDDNALAIALDASGSAYVTGHTGHPGKRTCTAVGLPDHQRAPGDARRSCRRLRRQVGCLGQAARLLDLPRRQCGRFRLGHRRR